MWRSVISGAAGLGVAFCLSMPAMALPIGLPSLTLPASARADLVPIRYHRHHRHHHEGASSTPAAPNVEATGTAASDEATIKPGRWEFAAQLQAGPLPPPGSANAAMAMPGGAMKSTYSSCIAGDNAVPAAPLPGCTIDNVRRDGPRVTWSMTCTNRHNAVHSDGVAVYSGDTMDASLTSHLPQAKSGAKPTDVAQRITGHYLGACPGGAQTAQNPIIPPRNRGTDAAAVAVPPGTAARSEQPPQWVEPPAHPDAAPAAAAATTEPPAAATGSATAPGPAAAPAPVTTDEPDASAGAPPTDAGYDKRRGRAARHWRHRGRWRRWSAGGYSAAGGYSGGYGPSPYSTGGY